jgi:2',3'-cyclic-nucleotide 2'-phosphodiesterase/3'-nucleotidase
VSRFGKGREIRRRLAALAMPALALLLALLGSGAVPAALRAAQPLPETRSAVAAPAPQSVTLTLLSTTDLHGHIEPFDDETDRPANWGLAKIATLVGRIRAERKNVVLLDCGDLIEGTPLAYYYARKDTTDPNPVILAMNALHYDAVALGNHEFNFGLDALWRAHREAKFPWLAANLRQTYASGPGHFAPYVIRKIGGIRVGIIGFVTPSIPHWEVPAHYRGYQFEPIVEAAKRVIPEVRRQADLVVAIVHSGLDRDPKTGRRYESSYPETNQAWELANEVPGIDVLFYGHTHQEMPELFVHGVLMAQAKNWGQSLAEADVTMRHSAGGRWSVAEKHSHVIQVTAEVPPDPAIERLDAPYNAKVRRYLNTPIATAPGALSGATGRVADTAMVDLIQAVQMRYGKADASMATMFVPSAHWPAGKITIRQVFALYPYENWLYTVRMTGAQLKDALEHAARFFPAWPARNGRLRLPGYNADSAAGVSYRVDLTKPVGARIVDLSYHGKPLRPGQTLRVAVNNYRYSGGGGYAVLQGLPILYQSSEEMRELIIDYLRAGNPIPAQPDHNWEVSPAAAREALIQEAEQPPHPFAAAGKRRRQGGWRAGHASATGHNGARNAGPLP